MHRLIYYELYKIWHKRSFIFSILLLMVLNLFILWYVNIPDNGQPSLLEYRSFQNKICKMTEAEKNDYMTKLKENIDSVSSMQEKELIDELFDEWQRVAGYNEYLQSIQQNKNNLSSISIFASQNENNFFARNIEKSTADYSDLSDSNIHWLPSKAFKISIENIWTDIFLILSVFFFTGNLIFEEKEKKLFYITRSTKKGQFQSILSKLTALLIHCIVTAVLFYGTNLIFAEITVGFKTLTANIQSVSVYMESDLSMKIWEYIFCSVLTKGIVLFSMGTIITALCIFAENVFLPYITGFFLYAISFILHLIISPVGKNSLFKYINFVGFMETESLYGDYLNFNIFEYPVSRLSLSWGVVIIIIITGYTISILLFLYGNNFEITKRKLIISKKFRPHTSLFCYEGYKIMITNRAVVIILLFVVLIGYRIMKQEHNPSVQEQYYKDIMLQLEGELTEEKKNLISSEQERYDEAFSEIERIDTLVINGEMDESAGENLKADLYMVTFFYSSFERVLQQYNRICKTGGGFIYDTGYMYLFGKMDNDCLIDLLLLSICLIMAFSNVIAMEYKSGSMYLLNTTKLGKRKILFKKAVVCIIAAVIISLVPIVCRFLNISAAYPLNGSDYLITDIPCYEHFPLSVPIWFFVILWLISQIATAIIETFIILLISYWRKNNIQTIFFTLLLLVVPLILKLLGL